MAPAASVNVNDAWSDEEMEPFAEVDPKGRFGRYDELLGSGAMKKVYRAFDHEEGKEVAWNQVKLRNFADNQKALDGLYHEVKILKSLKCENIISLQSAWTDKERSTLNFITDLCTSGNLREYRKKHKHVSMNAIKKWCKQILRGLEHLHTLKPCVIHRDLKCSNIFVNGNMGRVKIGDLGFATVKTHSAHHSCLGTPEYMAPELYEENYTELVDIYSFGMCVLEMVTVEIPYSECDSVAKIYKKVMAGVRPRALTKVKDPLVRAFIDKCLSHARIRPSASELLRHPFFDGIKDDDEDD